MPFHLEISLALLGNILLRELLRDAEGEDGEGQMGREEGKEKTRERGGKMRGRGRRWRGEGRGRGKGW